MACRIEIVPSAEREFLALPGHVQRRARKKILLLENEPVPPGARKLRGTSNFRLRLGAYRVLYTVDADRRIVKILSVGHRRDIYRRL